MLCCIAFPFRGCNTTQHTTPGTTTMQHDTRYTNRLTFISTCDIMSIKKSSFLFKKEVEVIDE